MKADLETVTDRLKKRGDEFERLKQRIASEENRRDLEIPKELYGNYYEIINKDIKNTKDSVDEIVQKIE